MTVNELSLRKIFLLMLVAYTNSAWAGWTGPTSTVELVSARRCSGEVRFSVRAFDGVISPQPGLYVLANGTGANSTTVTSGYQSVTDGASNIMCKRISGSTVTNSSQWCKFGDDYTSYSNAGGQIVATVSYDLDKPYAGDRTLYVGWDSKPWSYGMWTESNHWIGHASSGSYYVRAGEATCLNIPERTTTVRYANSITLTKQMQTANLLLREDAVKLTMNMSINPDATIADKILVEDLNGVQIPTGTLVNLNNGEGVQITVKDTFIGVANGNIRVELQLL